MGKGEGFLPQQEAPLEPQEGSLCFIDWETQPLETLPEAKLDLWLKGNDGGNLPAGLLRQTGAALTP